MLRSVRPRLVSNVLSGSRNTQSAPALVIGSPRWIWTQCHSITVGCLSKLSQPRRHFSQSSAPVDGDADVATNAGSPELQPDMLRLSKRMTDLGICSRREADEWIEKGWVLLNGKPAVLGMKVPAEGHLDIEISKEARYAQSQLCTILLNKPIGYVSGQAEAGHTAATALIKPDTQWFGRDNRGDEPLARSEKIALTRQAVFHPRCLKGLAVAGRLDIESSGLVVYTQDGRVARELIGEDSSVDKEYLVRVEGALSHRDLGLLNHGLELDGRQLRPALVEWVNEHQLRFVLREGRKRQIRRMCELVGLRVLGLKRVRVGGVVLGRLPVGCWRFLGPNESFTAPPQQHRESFFPSASSSSSSSFSRGRGGPVRERRVPGGRSGNRH